MTFPGDPVPVIGRLRPYRRRQLQEALRHATNLGASVLEVARAAIWLFGEDGRVLHRVHLYHGPGGEHSEGGELHPEHFPAYFRALEKDPRIAAANVHEDSRTAEFSDSYAAPLGISSWLDVPIPADGELRGIVRFEHMGPPREWTNVERRLGTEIGSMVGAVLERMDAGFGRARTVGPAGETPDRAAPAAVEAPPHPGPPSPPREPEPVGEPRAGPAAEEEAGEEAGTGRTPPERAPEPEARPSERGARRQAVLEQLPGAAILATLQGEILACNPWFGRLTGVGDSDQLEGRFLTEFISPPDGWQGLANRVDELGQVEGKEIQLRRPNGATTWLLVNARKVGGEPPHESQIVLVAVDIHERKNVEERLLRQAHRDPLTGVANRRLFREAAEQAFALAERQRRQAGLLYIDLRNFKRINDRFGHEMGDRVLTHVADRLRARGRESDLTARIGGDEFAVLLGEVEGLHGVRKAAERVQESLERPIQVDDRTIEVGATIGLALYPDHGRDVKTLIRRADAAMYRAKTTDVADIAAPLDEPSPAGEAGERGERSDGGGNPSGDGDVPFPGLANGADPPTSPPVEDAGATGRGLREALEAGELTVFYQPVFQTRGHEMVGAEALLRWPRSGGELLEAGKFVGVAEKEGFITELDRWTLRQVASTLHRWIGSGLVKWVSVNLSPVTLFSYDLVGFLEDLARWGEFPPSALMLEVDLDRSRIPAAEARRTVAELRAAGFRIALDMTAELSHKGAEIVGELDVDVIKMSPDLFRLGELQREDGSEGLFGEGDDGVLAGKKIESAGDEDSAVKTACSLVQGLHLAAPVSQEALEEDWS